ncbi:tripartite tricarboxylate transporter TctB family protein [Epibacterium sp. SM1969]|uniref:Tripartite tricarboxylate transporter TctB family protein n=1 Tax=Tritonibacter aquimaris TaxID=2663379 RepID=A0A844AVT4_9RHOB|nr:tripartite tricarboxylate transporter TctB family protein [Tritonibacter aquimaris]MQY43987.1 tripartite tricarboxylate transporter TctB family protein [Tritonibacter aquimaris]
MQYVLNFLTLFRRERRPGDLVFAIGFFGFSLIVAALLPSQAKFLGNKTLVAEPGFWPFVGVAMMVGFGALHLLSTYNAPRLPGRAREIEFWVRALEFVVWFAIYVHGVPKIGYLPATVLFAVILAIRLGYRGALALVSAGGFAVVVVLIFKSGLGVKLPAGEIYRYLPDGIRSFVMLNF